MIAFLIFVALMIACIVGSVCISMRLYLPDLMRYLQKHQLVTLEQEALVGGRSGKQRKLDIRMDECVQRVSGISLIVVGIVLLLVIGFLSAVLSSS